MFSSKSWAALVKSMIYQCKNNTEDAVMVAASLYQLVCSRKFLYNGAFSHFMGAAAWDE